MKSAFTGILQILVKRQTIIKTHGNFVSKSTTKNYTFNVSVSPTPPICLPFFLKLWAFAVATLKRLVFSKKWPGFEPLNFDP